jgi:hypothetical protein
MAGRRAEIVEVELDGGQVVLAEVLVPTGGDVGAWERTRFRLANFGEQVAGLSRTLLSSVRGQLPDAPKTVEVEFGMKLAVETGGLVAVLAQANAEASVVVRLTWDGPPAH